MEGVVPATLSPPLPLIGAGEPVGAVAAALADAGVAVPADLPVTRLDALRSLDAVDVSEAVFDPNLSWTNRLSGSHPYADITGGVPAVRWHDSDVALSQKFTWGGTRLRAA